MTLNNLKNRINLGFIFTTNLVLNIRILDDLIKFILHF